MNKLIVAGVATLLLGAAGPQGIDLDLKNSQNIVAMRLEGTWKARADLTLRLHGKEPGIQEITFAIERASVPENVFKKLGGAARSSVTVYAIGRMKLRAVDHPFLLIGLHGNPHLLYFRERNGDPFGDTESFNLMIAPGKEPKEDVLLAGGDFNNQPFSAFTRAR